MMREWRTTSGRRASPAPRGEAGDTRRRGAQRMLFDRRRVVGVLVVASLMVATLG
jgi:hypothetical protein